MQINRKKKVLHWIVAISLLSLILYLNFKPYSLRTKVLHTKNLDNLHDAKINSPSPIYKQPLDSKYILLWTNPTTFPFIYFENGYTVFRVKKCKFQNCYVTSDRSYFDDIRKFDVIAFNGPQLGDLIGSNDFPKDRSPHQKYVYANIEAAVYYPICAPRWNDFFNWTWTYKLNSDAVWGYIVIKNSSNHVIGPSMDIDWMREEDMLPIDDDIKTKLANKTNAAAWFVSNCRTMSEREKYVNAFQHFINEYNLKVDVYGDCGNFQCPKNIMNHCLAHLQLRYYFYFAFENALSEDYVSEKILHALNYYTVPVVYGGANYSRFLPPGSYLDALELGPNLLAEKIFEIIQKPELYYKFFRWRRYYSYHLRHESPETDDYCKFCAMINDKELMNKSTTYTNLSAWWNYNHTCSDQSKPSFSK